MKTPKRLLPAEVAALIYNAVTTLLIILSWHRLGDGAGMLWPRALIAGGTIALAALGNRFPGRAMTFIRVITQFGLLSFWYGDTFEFNRHFTNLDHIFASVEQALLGCQPAILFSERCGSLAMSEIFSLGYFSYYPLILTILIFCFFRKPGEFNRSSYVILASMFAYYLIYILLPVVGPMYYFEAIGYDNASGGIFPAVNDYFNDHTYLEYIAKHPEGLFRSLVTHCQQAGEHPTAAFPSSHVGISTIVIMLAYKARRALFFVMLPFYLILCGATVYIAAHYAIDVAAGLLSGVALYYLMSWTYGRCLR